MSRTSVSDIKTLRARAHRHIGEGAGGFAGRNPGDAAVKVLNDALATEIVCALRYNIHHFVAKGINPGPVADEFLEYAEDEQEEADRIAQRIVELGGDPVLSPEGLLFRSHTEYVTTGDLAQMIEEDLAAERIAIDGYREIAAYFAPFDPTSKTLIEEILDQEKEHADELARILQRLPKHLKH
jgi:bacterioferritin